MPYGSRFLEVRFWRRSQLTASIETAIQPTGTAQFGHPDGWATAANPPTSINHPDGWVRHVWRSPTPITSGTQQFARVRTSLP